MHEGQKFNCPQCEHKATRKGDLQRHVKLVHEGQQFPCPQCEYKASQKGNLQRHMKLVHEGPKFQGGDNTQRNYAARPGSVGGLTPAAARYWDRSHVQSLSDTINVVGLY